MPPWQTLKDHFQQAGPVVFADVFMDDMGRSKGCGIGMDIAKR